MGCRIQLCPVSAWPKAWREGWRGKGRGCQKSWGTADFWRKVSGRLSHWPQAPPDHPSNGCSTGRCLRKTWPKFSRLSRVSQSAAGGPRRPSPATPQSASSFADTRLCSCKRRTAVQGSGAGTYKRKLEAQEASCSGSWVPGA